MSEIFDQQFGDGKILEFYKYMGDDYNLWDFLFDFPDTDHLGGPIVITRLLSPLGFI
jgi:hypothetical protein